MAEAAGLVIGGVGLAALFDQCITIVKYFDTAASCSDDFQDAALMLTLLGGRLDRWQRSIRDNTDLQTTEEDDGENAEHWLKQIRKRLQEAEKFGSRYAVEQPGAFTTQASPRSKEISRLLGPLRTVLKQDGTLSMAKRARWALFDQEKMTALVDKLDKLIGSLEQLVPSSHDQRVQLARTEATGLLQSSEIEGLSQALEALKVAAAKVDKDFDVAAASLGNSYRNIDITGDAMVSTGDYYSEEWVKAGGSVGKGGNNSYDGIRVSGSSTVSLGHSYGGKSVFETRRT